jgi:cobalt-zinc-cadmium efflux system protein
MRLRLAMGLTALILLVEVAGGWYANSLALLSDAVHVLTDLGSLGLTYGAFVLASRPATARKTWGWYRLEVLAALLNGALLVALAAGIFIESFRRLHDPPVVLPGPMILAAAVGLAGNIATVAILAGGRRNLNLRAALLHVVSDTLVSVGVVATAVVLFATGWKGADPFMGLAIGLVIVVGAIRLLREATDVLLEAAPAGIELDRVGEAISGIPGVLAVHDLHVWSITSGMTALSGHVVVDDRAAGADETLNRIKRLLHDRFAIAHSTLQVESPGYEEFGEIHD